MNVLGRLFHHTVAFSIPSLKQYMVHNRFSFIIVLVKPLACLPSFYAAALPLTFLIYGVFFVRASL